ncbi:MAG: nucleotide exchange factor GrpE [Deltaproteobacteria bacterium]|nr:nucleotide exchange factor GrpE [Deltaproteobacteria bacterium]
MSETLEKPQEGNEPAATSAASTTEAQAASAAIAEADLLKAKAELEEQLEKTRGQTEELKNRWLRAAADFDNYKKRVVREREEAVRFANETLLKDFLPVVDDLDRTREILEKTDVQAAGLASILEGVSLVQRKFSTQLEKHGVTLIETGGGFDPAKHEAVQQVFSDSVPAGGVASEVRRGYYLNGRLLRAALVAVSLGAEPKPGGDGGAST